MNKIASSDFTVDNAEFSKPVDAISPATPKNSVVANLMKAWESKLTQRTAKGAGFTLMAVSLAACNDDDVVADDVVADDVVADDVVADDVVADDVVADDVVADDVVADDVTFESAVQESAAAFLTKIAAADEAVETATIAVGATAVVLSANDLDADEAETTAVEATADFDVAYGLVATELLNLEASHDILVEYDTVLGDDDLASLIVALGSTAVTAAARADIVDTLADVTAALAFEASSDAADVASLLAIANANAPLATAAEIAAGAGLVAVGAFIGTNAATVALSGDTSTATASEVTAGVTAFAAAIHDALLANSEEYADEFDALDADDQQLVLDAVFTSVDARISTTPGTDINLDTISGAVVADDDAAETLEDAGAAAFGAVAGITVDPAGDAANTGADAPADIVFTYAAAATAQNNVVTAAEDQGFDAVITAAYEELIEAAQAVADAAQIGAIQELLAGVVSTESLGEDNIAVAGGAATEGNDVFIVSEAGGAVTVGTAATTAAPENVFGGVGDDSIVILGDYTFVTITETQSDAIGATSLGDAAVLEIFVYQDATTKNAVLHIEDNAYDGNDKTDGALTTLTITDTTFADLTSITVGDYTILSSASAIA